MAFPLEFPGSWPYPLHDTVKESHTDIKRQVRVLYFSSMHESCIRTDTVLPALRPNNFGLGWSEGIVSPNFVGIVDFRF